MTALAALFGSAAATSVATTAGSAAAIAAGTGSAAAGSLAASGVAAASGAAASAGIGSTLGSLFTASNIFTGLQVGSGLLGIAQQNSSTSFQNELISRQIQSEKVSAELERERQRKLSERFASAQTLASGASGFTLEGTPTEVIANTAGQFGTDQFTRDFNTQNRINQILGNQQSRVKNARNLNIGRLFNIGASLIRRG